MSAYEIVTDAEVVPDEQPGASTALAPRLPATLSVAPQVEAEELGRRLAVIKAAMEQQMTGGVDYGVIPGTNKPTLLKPGAEKLSVLFQLDVQLENTKTYGPGEHLTVESKATVFHAPTGQRLGFGEGLCTSREKKYGKRRLDRKCPNCGQPTVLKSKEKPEWFCWRKKGGCGATFPAADQRLTNQEVGDVENPELPDTWNTIIKMAEKRARVDAILSVTGASALFTQDVEDQQVPDNEQPAAAPAPPRFGEPLDPAMKRDVAQACVALCDNDSQQAMGLFQEVAQHCGGYMPQAAGVALLLAAKTEIPVYAPEVN